MKNLIILAAGLLLINCSTKTEDANLLVDKTIELAGGDNFNSVEIEFTFRDKEYGAKMKDGKYEYVRLFKDSSNLYRDVLSNDGFYREINGEKADIPDSMAVKYSNSVNSVIYFALLPKGLNDAAVNKTYLGSEKIKENDYHKIKVTFDENGGGKDFEDIFIYWINKSNHKIDYLAYQYYTDGGGFRFREAYNERIVEGIRFVDYINYKPNSNLQTELEKMGEAFKAGQLEELSRVELENVRVNKL
ncbi:hypothetical protein GCM10009122_12380 [Fulvivirga kasyanovii]|uniref:Deoxyribose-phosphate aldolase n=1 Tax=Fulvivirga kasyanovii TaxID=396812 RepID=A0ABW9RLG8_9BACT|nr:DUF6503 family protein [Fulvivirga kasyanovii]MTI24672.1 hypothetical protein [Fulvivirga kasyanovii]